MVRKQIEEILAHYGLDNQIHKALEELSELSCAILKNINKNAPKQNILEEMADVYIMLEQLKIIYSFDNETLDDVIYYKIQRTIERMNHEGWEQY